MKKNKSSDFLLILLIIILVGGFIYYKTDGHYLMNIRSFNDHSSMSSNSNNNDSSNISSNEDHSSMNMGTNTSPSMNGNSNYMSMDKSNGMNMGSTDPNATPVTKLVAQNLNAPVKTFNITAQVANLNLGGGAMVEAWTYGGSAPGPEIRVKEGDRVVVNLTNKLPEGVTIHWHGLNIPGAVDGVAGVTQDAIKPGETYTYNFIADQPGTYWYHSHQQSEVQTGLGLFGAVVVEPKEETIKYDKDYTVVLHEWNINGLSKKKNKDKFNDKGSFNSGNLNNELVEAMTDVKYNMLTTNGTIDSKHFDAKPGDLVRLRLVNTGNTTHLLTLLGIPFQVVSLDGRDLVGGQTTNQTLLPIGGGNRVDISFRVPDSGNVQLVNAGPDASQPNKKVSVSIGNRNSTGTATSDNPNNYKLFDFMTYGTPQKGVFNSDSTFTQTVDMELSSGKVPGMDWAFLINGQAAPNIQPLVIKEGDTVKIKFVNDSNVIHPMHIHGHTLQVLTRNGKAAEGSPVYLDTLNVLPHETYEVAFVADNPGIWMIHCHNLKHAAMGMNMMVNYEGISTPFVVGGTSGNHPD
ncbi:multicopper oxidase family protein [Paenibacillus sp. GCM10012306]|uniref:multicopper oxidase family protein n=1 Tax=Paenibacillus sp. GCM10012306 TaxID=3317342 RepID=UPI003620FE60